MRLMTSLASIAPRAMLATMLAAMLAAPSAARERDPEAELAKMLAGRTAGPPSECIPLSPTQSSTTIERTGIVYRRGTTLYVSRFEGGCPELDSMRILIIRSTTSQICRGDIADVRTQPPSMFVGSCTFGPFVPYAKAK